MLKDGFKHIDDILLEVAEEEGLSKREIRDIWKHHELYTHYKMEQDGVYSIFLPYIGTLSLNSKQVHREKRYQKLKLYSSFIKKASDLLLHKNYSYYDNSHKKVTGVNKLARYIYNNYDTGLKLVQRRLIPHKICWDIIEKYSNGFYEKKDTKS